MPLRRPRAGSRSRRDRFAWSPRKARRIQVDRDAIEGRSLTHDFVYGRHGDSQNTGALLRRESEIRKAVQFAKEGGPVGRMMQFVGVEHAAHGAGYRGGA